MTGVTNILAADAQLKADIATQNGLIVALLTAFANQTLTPAQSAEILADIQGADASVVAQSAAINAALNPAPPAPAPAAPAAPAAS